MKLGIIGGAGRLGGTTAFCCGLKGFLEEIKLMDVKENFAAANVMDMQQAFLPVSHTKVTLAKDYSDFTDCDIILSSAAKPFSKDIKDRAQELMMNVEIIAPICEQLKKHCRPDTKVIVSTNPVDVLVYIYQQLLGWEPKQFLGLAVNDTIRLKWATEMVTGKQYAEIGGICVGEHGNGAVRLYDQMTYGQAPLNLSDVERADIEVLCAEWFGNWTALETGTTTGYTSGVMMSLMIEAIATDSGKIIPCSTPMISELGYEGISMGIPVRLGSEGVQEVINPCLTESQKVDVRAAADKIRSMIEKVLQSSAHKYS